MALETISLIRDHDICIPASLLAEVLQATTESRYGDAYHLARAGGPLELWPGGEAKLLAGRLARHLGSTNLYWRLTAQACREMPRATRFQVQRVYAVMEKRGSLAAWQTSRRLDQTESDTEEEKADGLVCQGFCHVIFRDFDSAQRFFSQARALTPKNPWVWSETSSLMAEQGDHAGALEQVEYALDLNPLFRPAIQRKAHYLQSLQRDDEAYQLLETARHQLQSAAVINQLIVLCSEREEWAFTLELLEESKQLSPLADEGLQSWFSARRADALIGLGRLTEAADQARRVSKNIFYQNLARRLESNPVPGRRVKIPVPFIQQDYNTCAPATLSAVTTFWENPIPQDTLIGEICYDGTYDFVERRWAEEADWHVREFRVTWDTAVALLDRGIPFILTTQEINSAHSQAVIGYDTVRQSFLLRDPSTRHFTEYGYAEFEKHYAPVGPRGLLILPPSRAGTIADIPLPETDLYDLTYALNCALKVHDRVRAADILQSLDQRAPGHRLTWMGRRALAHYDQNPLAHLEAVDGLLKLFPDDDRLLNARLQLLRSLGRTHEASDLLRIRSQKPKVPPLFWREHARGLGLEKEKSEAAVRLILRALKSGPRDVDNLTALADVFWNSQQRHSALAIQHLAVCVADKKEPVVAVYFQMQEACGQTEAGIDFLRQRTSASLSRSSAPTITLVNALDRLNQSAEVRLVLDAALAQRPDDGDLHLRYANFLATCGRLEESRSFLERARSSTQFIAWLRAAAQLERLIGNFDQALGLWQQLAELSPLDIEAHRQIAWLLARRDGKGCAEDYVRAIGRRFPLHRGLLELEVGWLKKDAPDEIEHRLTTYLETNPSDAWARRERALFLQSRFAFDDALAEAQEARQFEPYQAVSWQVEAGVLESMNRIVEARECLHRALEINIDSTYAIRRLLSLTDSSQEKKEVLRFIRDQLDRQTVSGPGVIAYREAAFPILEMEELTADLHALWQKRSDLWETWHTLLHHYIAVGRLEEASEVVTGSTQRFPMLPTIWRDAARLNQRLNAWTEASHCLLHALQLNPDWAPVIRDLSAVYRRNSQPDEARELLERSHNRNPLEATVLGSLADLMWHTGERERALAQVIKSVDINPDYNWGWNALARWSELLQKKNIALEMARERANRLDLDASAWLMVAQLARRPELAGERLEAAFRARECEPRNIEAHDISALALAEQRRFAEAMAACRPEIFGTRIPVSLRGREAWLWAEQSRFPEAIDKMKKVVADDPYFLSGWDLLTDWYYLANRFPESLEASQKLIRLSPLEATGYGKSARAHAKVNHSREAKIDYQKALALDPGYGFAGWQLFQMQLAEKDLQGAASTLTLMQSHTSPGIMLPAQIILAGKQGRWQEALEVLEQVALLLEVDSAALKAAFEVLDAGGQRKKVDHLLTSLISNPDFNPHIASVWADRIHLAKKWNLFSYLKKIPDTSPAFEAILKNVVLGTKTRRYPVRLVGKLVARYPLATRKHTQVWGVIGQIFTSGGSWARAAAWLKDWETRPDAQGWMVTNLVFSLQSWGRTKEADAVTQKLLSKGLRDHTAAYHLLYLALSDLERHDTHRAREFLQGVHLESQHKHDMFFKLAVEQVLAVQEASPGPERRRASAQARQRLSSFGLKGFKSRRVLKAEIRAAFQMARDSGSLGAWAYAARIGLVSWLSPAIRLLPRNRYIRLAFIFILIIGLQLCSASRR